MDYAYTTIYRLAIDGDDFERYYWGLFIRDQFPSYEKFWLNFVVPLTNRPGNIHFKTDAELAEINKSTLDLCIAQLNYSIVRHLMRCFDVLSALQNSIVVVQQLDLLIEGMTRLVGAQDNASELLGRLKSHRMYESFPKDKGETARKARKAWQKDNNQNEKNPLQHIRDYRNSLVHGRLLPRVVDGKRLCMLDIGKEDKYLDWRFITELSSEREEYKKDFISVLNILESAWNETVMYLENHWKSL